PAAAAPAARGLARSYLRRGGHPTGFVPRQLRRLVVSRTRGAAPAGPAHLPASDAFELAARFGDQCFEGALRGPRLGGSGIFLSDLAERARRQPFVFHGRRPIRAVSEESVVVHCQKEPDLFQVFRPWMLLEEGFFPADRPSPLIHVAVDELGRIAPDGAVKRVGDDPKLRLRNPPSTRLASHVFLDGGLVVHLPRVRFGAGDADAVLAESAHEEIRVQALAVGGGVEIHEIDEELHPFSEYIEGLRPGPPPHARLAVVPQ